MDKIYLKLKRETDNSYEIFLDAGIFERIPKHLKDNPIGNKYAIITDSNVRSLYGERLLDGLKDEGLRSCLIDFPAGEESKNLKTVEHLANKLIGNDLDRKSVIIALGGGVVGDVVGFMASIYMRGISYIQTPTTLMSQVDSSIGGKTGVDLPEGKNLLGAFYQPRRVYIDPTILSMLPGREFKSGLAEVIKYGVICDRELFEYLEKNIVAIKRMDVNTLMHIISRSSQTKAEIVEKDEKEENLRAILNYGHTFGHAVEKCGDYKTFLHGEAVSIGMNFAGCLAAEKGFWSWEDLKRQNKLISSFDLPLKSKFKSEELIKAVRHDKKVEGSRIMFVFPESIGKMAMIDGKYRIPVPENELVSALGSLV